MSKTSFGCPDGYREVLEVELPWLDSVEAAKAPKRLPVVLTQPEVQALLGRLRGTHWLIANLLYGAGLRLTEALRLRVKDVDFARREVLVRDGKGFKDRVTMLPVALAEPLQQHLAQVRELHQQDLAEGRGAVQLPYALARKYPNAAAAWAWQFVFPSARLSVDPRDPARVVRRHHVQDVAIQRALKQAVRDAGLAKPATPHTLRHELCQRVLCCVWAPSPALLPSRNTHHPVCC